MNSRWSSRRDPLPDRKLAIYLVTFVVAVTIDWAIPRLMPGDPIERLLSRMQAQPSSARRSRATTREAFGFDVPLWKQYLNFWAALFHGDLGRERRELPDAGLGADPRCAPVHAGPAHPGRSLLSFWTGNKVGALAARRKASTTRCCRSRTFSPRRRRCGSGSCSSGSSRSRLAWLPVSGAYSLALQPTWTLEFALSFLEHWILPFSALFLVAFGGWAIGMRNMIIYELEADYSNYLAALGAPTKLVRKYAFRNALLPQITGLALALGAVVAGAIVVEIVFSYPGSRDAHAGRDPEPGLLPDPGNLPVPHRRRPDRELRDRHRLCDRRPAHPGRDARWSVTAVASPG